MNKAETEVTRTCYSPTEVARSIGVCPQLIDRWLKRDDDPLPAIRDGRRIIIPYKLLEEWLARQAEKTA